MPIRQGEEYLESLRDGRCLWLMGQRVEDVTTHPALAGCARSVADVYDLQHPEIGPHLRQWVVGEDEAGAERLLKLAWDYACDTFGSRQLLFEMYNVSSLATNKQRLVSSYDTSPCVSLVKDLAGIARQAVNGG